MWPLLLLLEGLLGEVVFWAVEEVLARTTFTWATGLIKQGQDSAYSCIVLYVHVFHWRTEHKIHMVTGAKSE